MSRPAGFAFLGSKATTVAAKVNGTSADLIIDSGSDITLISSALWNQIQPKPKLKTGHKVNLIQVTGKSTISGFAELQLEFPTEHGDVQMSVEAYVVKGMNTPFLLGNDFADQYALSIVRKEDKTWLVLGSSGRRVPVVNSVGPHLRDDEGRVFGIIKSRHVKRKTKRTTPRTIDVAVKTKRPWIIPPETVASVPVEVSFPGGIDHLFVEKVMSARRGTEDMYGSPDSIINRNSPILQIANFSPNPIRLSRGETVGIGHDPRLWLDRWNGNVPAEQDERYRHALAVSSLLKEVKKAHLAEEVGDEPVEGGPKTGESPEPESIKKEDLLTAVDIPKHLTDDQRKRLEEVVVRNHKAFGLDGRLGEYKAKVRINLRPDAKEVSLAPYSASPAKRETIDKQMDSWLSLGVIEPSESPWGFPVLIVYRNNKARMCIDYRKLNAMTIPDEYPLPKQSDIIQSLTGSQWLSSLDALSGFTQLEIVEEDRPKTAFRSHRGLYQFRRMPFGLRNGPSIFQRVMQNVLAPYLWMFALVYIDDIIVYSKSFDEHLKHLDAVLSSIAKANLTLAPAKCHLAYQSLLLLGQKVSRLGMSTHKEKISAILDLDVPRNINELRTFLGMVVYFSGYIPFYAWIVAPLFALLKKGAKWEWNDLEQRAFELAKESLVNAPIRAYAIPGKGFRLYTDACDEGLAGILQQIQPIQVKDLKGTKVYERLKKAFDAKESVPKLTYVFAKDHEEELPEMKWEETLGETVVYVERVIAYWSRILKSAERNYSPTEREALALKESLIKFQPYIEGEKLVAITDHAALTWSKTYQNVNRRLLTWGTVFAAYPDMQIVHRAGRVHSNVDPISRLRRRTPRQEGPVVDDSAVLALEAKDDPLDQLYNDITPGYEERVLKLMKELAEKSRGTKLKEQIEEYEVSVSPEITVSANAAKTISTTIAISPEELEAFREGYQKDVHYSKVLEDLASETDWRNPRRPQYYTEDGLIYFSDWEGRGRLCVPKMKRAEIMQEMHDNISLGAHQGFAKTYNRIASVYYWPRMSRDIKVFVRTCDPCQKAKARRHAPYGYLRSIPIPSQPFEVVTMDFITDLPVSGSFNAVLTIVDKLTKLALFIPTTTDVSDEGTARLFFERVWGLFGLPRQIISDRDSRWAQSFWKELTRLVGTRRALTTAHHPQADGQTEIMNQVLETALRTYVNDKRDNWHEKLVPFQHAYNTCVHSSTGYSPSFLLFGFQTIDPESLLTGSTKESIRRDLTGNRDAEEFAEEMSMLRHSAQDSLRVAQAFQERAYNKGRLDHEFEEGDQVLINPHTMNLLRTTTGKGKKLLAKYDGPFEVLTKLSPITYRLRLPASYKIHPVINIAHLQPYHESPSELGVRSKKHLNRGDFDELPEYEVERIIEEKWENVPAKKGRKPRRVKRYLTRFVGYGPEWDEWLSPEDLRNAPLVLQEWKDGVRTRKEERTHPDPVGEEIRHEPYSETSPNKEQHEAASEQITKNLPASLDNRNKEISNGRQLRSRRAKKVT